MNQRIQTVVLVAIAALLAAVAYFTQPTAPTLDEFDDQGQPFYPDFTDPLLAVSLEVIEFDESSGSVRPFKVEVKGGKWSIPSHHDYPADGEKRLAETAAALIDLERDVIQSNRQQDYEKLGVIDPLDEGSTALQGRGARVTLRGEGGTVLADFIIGREVESKPGFRFVRLPDKKRTYAVDVKIDLSTRFADWIDTNLLDVQASDLTEIEIKDYTIDETTGSVELAGTINVDKGADNQWVLRGEAPDGRELDTTKVSTMVNALRNLTIVGVRPKPASLSADLRSSEGLKLDMGTQLSLQAMGFFVSRDGRLLSNEGEVGLGTNEGVRYTLRFGEVLCGEGMSVSAGTGEADEEADADPAAFAAKENRYLFLTANFDETLLGAKPVMPQGYTPKPTEDGAGAFDAALLETATVSADPDAMPNLQDDAAPPVVAPPTGEDEEASEAAREGARQGAIAAYEMALADWEAKAEIGRARTEELNDRFAAWYYVISGSDFQDIRVNLETITKGVEAIAG